MPVFDDSAKVAAAEWLGAQIPATLLNEQAPSKTIAEYLSSSVGEESKIRWEGQWLHQPRLPSEEASSPQQIASFQEFRTRLDHLLKNGVGTPSRYYAILIMDADNFHRQMAGSMLPYLRNIPEISQIDAESIKQPWLRSIWEYVLGCRQPLTPDLHQGFSKRQSTFGRFDVPNVIAESNGQLIFCGGDEFLALLPVATVFDAAKSLRDRFSTQPYFPSGSMSAGIAISHFSTDLRQSLMTARKQLRIAKSRGKNLCCTSFVTRSGKGLSVPVPWSFMHSFQEIVKAFAGTIDLYGEGGTEMKPISDGWLRRIELQWDRELSGFETTDGTLHPAIVSQIGYQVGHSESSTLATLARIGNHEPDTPESVAARETVLRWLHDYVAAVSCFTVAHPYTKPVIAAGEFLLLCRLAAMCVGKGDRA